MLGQGCQQHPMCPCRLPPLPPDLLLSTVYDLAHRAWGIVTLLCRGARKKVLHKKGKKLPWQGSIAPRSRISMDCIKMGKKPKKILKMDHKKDFIKNGSDESECNFMVLSASKKTGPSFMWNTSSK